MCDDSCDYIVEMYPSMGLDMTLYVASIVSFCCFVVLSMCLFTVSNALFMPSATVRVHPAGLFWLKHIAMVLFMWWRTVFVEWLLVNPCSVDTCGMFFVMYGSSVFSSILLSLREEG